MVFIIFPLVFGCSSMSFFICPVFFLDGLPRNLIMFEHLVPRHVPVIALLLALPLSGNTPYLSRPTWEVDGDNTLFATGF